MDDASTPEHAFGTFRGALAREEFDRAYGLLSDRLRRKLGVRSRADFMDWGALDGRKAVSAMRRAKLKGPPEMLEDGRALLRVRVSWLIFGRTVRVWLARQPVARVFVDGSDSAAFYDHLDDLTIVEADGVVGVRLTPDMRERLLEAVKSGRVSRLLYGMEWFLDDFDMGVEERDE